MQTPQQKVKNYFNNLESRIGYSLLLKGTKHFGYYPKGKTNISMTSAQKLMEDKLAEALNLKKGSRVLDAGCGEGVVASYLAKKYRLHIAGIDLLNWAIKNSKINAKKMDVENLVDFQIMDYTKLSFPANHFDGVYTMETFVHSPDYRKGLQEFYRVLKPKGKLVMVEYSISPFESMTDEQKYFSKLIIEGGAMHSLPFFIHGRFPKILESIGFRNVSVKNTTPFIMPMLRKFYLIGFLPYQLIKLLRLQKSFINATSAVEGYKFINKSDIWRYNIITATK